MELARPCCSVSSTCRKKGNVRGGCVSQAPVYGCINAEGMIPSMSLHYSLKHSQLIWSVAEFLQRLVLASETWRLNYLLSGALFPSYLLGSLKSTSETQIGPDSISSTRPKSNKDWQSNRGLFAAAGREREHLPPLSLLSLSFSSLLSL